MPSANSLVGEDFVMPDEDVTQPVSKGSASADDFGLSRGVAFLFLMSVAIIVMIRLAGLQAMIAVGRGT